VIDFLQALDAERTALIGAPWFAAAALAALALAAQDAGAGRHNAGLEPQAFNR
jgi:hypothetical protein